MKVLISIQLPVEQWQIPPECVETLRRRFPDVQFMYATTPEQRAAGLRECEVAYTWILKPEEAETASRLKWVHTSAVAVETLCLDQLFAHRVEGGVGDQEVDVAAAVLHRHLGAEHHRRGRQLGDRGDRKSTRLNSSHSQQSRMPSSA